MKVELQVNMHFSPNVISGCGLVTFNNRKTTGTVIYAPNLPTLLRKTKKMFGAKLENITLTFQPEYVLTPDIIP